MNRRSFITASAAGVTVAASPVKSVLAAGQQAEGWYDKKPINPDIDNMRVICMYDENMSEKGKSPTTFDNLNTYVKADAVRSNLDRMAMELAQKTTADEAWKTILRSGKPWADTKVMIKLNAVSQRVSASVATVKKISDVLIGFGVQPKNIVLFDGQGGNWNIYTKYCSLTDETKIRGIMSRKYDDLGGQANATISQGGNAPKGLVDGAIDIIVNIAVNKGHESPTFHVGMLTLCLKNHFGTFLRSGMAMHLHSTAALIAINKAKEIIGGDPVRQQLCIIDNLWAARSGPDTSVTHQPNCLIMGTFAGAVDYCCAKKIREELMKVTNHEASVITKFLTEFGYKETDPLWVELSPTGTIAGKVNPPAATRSVSFMLAATNLRQSTIKFDLPEKSTSQIRVRIYDLRGGLVRELSAQANALSINWDGKATNGSVIGTGNYVVQLSAGRFKASQKIALMR